MTDPAGGVPDPEPRCPWCSSAVAPDAATCPSCGAVLREPRDDVTSIPGVTRVDPIIATRKPLPQPNRIVRWLAGDVDPLPAAPPPTVTTDAATGRLVLEAASGASGASIAPPSDAVRREMARLELEAIRAELEANAPEATVNDVPPGRAEGDAPA